MYDEMLNKNGLKPRKIYDELFSWLNNQNSSTLLNQSNKAEELFRRVGITFNVYGENEAEERLIPFDIVPRIIEKKEWSFVKKGIEQRLLAINMFLKDVYFDQKIIKEGIIPSEFLTISITRRPGFGN